MLTRHVQGRLQWLDLVTPTSPEVKALMEEFDIDPRIAQELLVPSFRQKVERSKDMVYITLHFAALNGIGRRAEQEIDFIIGKNFLITGRYEMTDALHRFAKAFEVESVLGNNGHRVHGGHLFVEMTRNLYMSLIEECELLEDKLADIEERIFNGRGSRLVAEISQTARVIHDFRQSLLPHQEMLTSFEPVASLMFGQEFLHYVRELEGVQGRLDMILKNLRESLIELRETHNSLLTTKQNDIMRTLTVLTFLFLPLVFIGGLVNMYVQYGGTSSFWYTICGMLVIAFLSYLYFKRKDWI